MIRYTCLDPDLGPYPARLIRPTLRYVDRSPVLLSRARAAARTQPFPPLNPHYKRPSGHSPCVKSCLVGGRDEYSPRDEADGINFLLALTPAGFFSRTLAFVSDGALCSKGRLEAERPPASTRPPSGGRAASLIPLLIRGPV